MSVKFKMQKTVIITLCIIAVLFFAFVFYKKIFWFDLQYQQQIDIYCKEYNVPQELVYGVIKVESNFDVDAISKKGAVGLMQIMPNTATFVAGELKLKNFDLKDPINNLQIGIYYLSYLSGKFNDTNKVIIAYNAGENIVKKWIRQHNFDINDIPYKETKIYLKRVNFFIKVYKKMR